MKPGEIIEVYKTRFKKLLKYYHNLLEDFEAKDIHHFRLEMKKLKAFLRLISVTFGDHHYKIPKDLKLFYNLTGNIRNLQLHRKRIIDLCNDLLLEIPAEYLQYLDDEERALKKQARQTAKDLSIKDFENKLIGEVPGKLTKAAQSDFIQKALTRFNELLALSFYTDEALHEIRRIIKDLMYNSKYIGLDSVMASFPGLRGLKAMNVVTATLGDYHDLYISLSLLNAPNVTGITGADETEVLNELRIQLQLRKDVMKIEIIELMKQLNQGVVAQQIHAPLP